MSKHKCSFVQFPGVRPEEVAQPVAITLVIDKPECPHCGEPMINDYRLGGTGALVDPYCVTPSCQKRKRSMIG